MRALLYYQYYHYYISLRLFVRWCFRHIKNQYQKIWLLRKIWPLFLLFVLLTSLFKYQKKKQKNNGIYFNHFEAVESYGHKATEFDCVKFRFTSLSTSIFLADKVQLRDFVAYNFVSPPPLVMDYRCGETATCRKMVDTKMWGPIKKL